MCRYLAYVFSKLSCWLFPSMQCWLGGWFGGTRLQPCCLVPDAAARVPECGTGVPPLTGFASSPS